MTDTTNQPKPSLFLVVAMARNRVIGKGNDLPWHIPEDLKRFKALTMGKPVILGRKTFDSIVARLGKSLPGRPHYVVTRGGVAGNWDDVKQCASLENAVAQARTDYPDQDIAIIGGASIYQEAVNLVDMMYLTIVDTEIDGDAFFPDFNADDWEETAREQVENAAIRFETVTLVRK